MSLIVELCKYCMFFNLLCLLGNAGLQEPCHVEHTVRVGLWD